MDAGLALARLRTFRALRNHNFRLFWSGQLVSLTGSWIHRTAQAWLVLKLTDSPLAVGLVSTLQFLPTLLFGLLGGWIADRFDRRRALIVTQAAAALTALLLAVLTQLGRLDLPTLAALALALGLVQVADAPLRHAFLVEMVEREDVANAVALNSAVFNAARVAGPALAGLLIARAGFATCFYLNALSYLAAIAALLYMRPELLRRGDPLTGPGSPPTAEPPAERRGRAAPRPRLLDELQEGIEYAWRTRDVRMVIGLMAVVGTFGINFNVLLPILAERSLGWDAVRYGLLFSALGAGSLAGALLVATLGRAHRGLVLAGALSLGLAQVALAALPSPATAPVLVFLCGLASIAYTASSNGTVQLSVPDRVRGRVVGLYLYTFMGTTPLGNLLMGYLAERGGAPLGFAVAGGATALAAACAWALWVQPRRAAEPARALPRAPE